MTWYMSLAVLVLALAIGGWLANFIFLTALIVWGELLMKRTARMKVFLVMMGAVLCLVPWLFIIIMWPPQKPSPVSRRKVKR